MTDEPTQPQKPTESEKGLLSGFGGLAGIDEAKDIYTRKKTSLEIILKVGEEIVNKYYQTMPNINDKEGLGLMGTFYSDVYGDVSEKLKDVAYDVHEIEAFVLTKANPDESYTFETENKPKMLGLYTGCLAQLLTERNKAQGKRTCIYVNGSGSRFDYLFLFAREVDTIVVENFNGNNICSYIGSLNGHAERVIARNITGNRTLKHIAYNNGAVNQVLGINLAGNEIVSYICSDGSYTEQVVGVNLDSKFQVMRGIGSDNARINQLIAKEVNGLETLTCLALNGRINQILFDEIKSPFAFSDCAESDGKINMIVGGCVEGQDVFHNLGKDVGLLAYPTFTPPHDFDPEKIVSIESLRKLESIWEQVKFDDVSFCLHVLKTASYQRLLTVADELYALRPAVPEGFFKRK